MVTESPGPDSRESFITSAYSSGRRNADIAVEQLGLQTEIRTKINHATKSNRAFTKMVAAYMILCLVR